jgi:hypothetical protein
MTNQHIPSPLDKYAHFTIVMRLLAAVGFGLIELDDVVM